MPIRVVFKINVFYMDKPTHAFSEIELPIGLASD